MPALILIAFLASVQTATPGPAGAKVDIPVVPGIPTLYHRAAPPPAGQPMPEVLLYPPFDRPFLCGDHPEGDVGALGDAFGTDCMVVGGFGDGGGAQFFRLYRGDGTRNEDWYGWRTHVLAPIDGTVRKIVLNPVVNRPGTMGSPPSSLMVFQRADGLVVTYGHIADPLVREGDAVKAGQIVALDGNNGMARSPHLHIGAFRDHTPYQIRWDQRAEGRMAGFR